MCLPSHLANMLWDDGPGGHYGRHEDEREFFSQGDVLGGVQGHPSTDAHDQLRVIGQAVACVLQVAPVEHVYDADPAGGWAMYGWAAFQAVGVDTAT